MSASKTKELRELDARVAEEVFGYEWRESDHNGDGPMRILLSPGSSFEKATRPATGNRPNYHDWDREVPYYSTDMAAAWEIVEELERKDYDLKYQSRGRRGIGPRVTVQRPGESGSIHGQAEARTAAIAICRAALAAVPD